MKTWVQIYRQHTKLGSVAQTYKILAFQWRAEELNRESVAASSPGTLTWKVWTRDLIWNKFKGKDWYSKLPSDLHGSTVAHACLSSITHTNICTTIHRRVCICVCLCVCSMKHFQEPYFLLCVAENIAHHHSKISELIILLRERILRLINFSQLWFSISWEAEHSC